MLDRTPVLLGPPGDLPHVRKDAVCIPAIDAIELLDDVQVREVLPIDDDVRRAGDAGNPVNPEAHGLVRRDPQIQHEDRHG